MTEVVSVRFKSKGKVYYFDPNGNSVAKGDNVIVETAKGFEYAECVRENHPVDDSLVVPPLRPVIRIATEEDAARAEMNRKKEAEAFEVCREKIIEHKLDMKLVDVEYSFDGSKILFCFTSDGRVDFRELVKDLAATFKMRIELRQIGVRDEARMLGGLGICGKPFCCAQFLNDFQPVSIKMAKTQGLSLNPTKISGTCGRLMCCLKYEQDAYEDLVKKVPKVDAFVDTPDGKGMVTDVNLLRSRVRVKLENQNELTMRTYEAADVSVLGGKAQRAEYLAAVAEGRIVEPVRKPAPQIKDKIVSDMPEVRFDGDNAEKPEKNQERKPKRDRRQKPQNQEAPAFENLEKAPAEKQKPEKKQKNQGKKQRQKTDTVKVDEKSADAPDNRENNVKEPSRRHKFNKRRNSKQNDVPQQSAISTEAQAMPISEDNAKPSAEKSQKPHRRPYYRKRNNKKTQNKANNE